MVQTNTNDNVGLAKAKAFFDRAEQVAATDNFDYAIDMYMEGLRLAPDALDQGHKKLRLMALIRHGKGGKKPSIVEKLKRSRGKDELEQMLNAEFLLAKDPNHLPYAETMLKAAVASGCNKTAEWTADLIFEANRSSDQPSLQIFLLLKDNYAALGKLEKAVAACQWAVNSKRDDGQLADEVRNLSAQLTMQRGQYEHKGDFGDFRDSIKDREKQTKLQAQERVVKTKEYLLSAIEDARKKLAEDPESTDNILNLASTLADMQQDDCDSQAVELLGSEYERTSDFSFKSLQNQIQIKQLKRKIRQIREAFKAEPGNTEVKNQLVELIGKLNKAELEHHQLCVQHYPTDARMKYDLGLSYMRNRLYDEAIPMLQDARKDPRSRIAAMGKIGVCFYMKDWLPDAIDIFKQAIDTYEIKDDETAKELRYNLARCYEQQGKTDQALEIYHKLAQLDFGYKDIRGRIDKLRTSNQQDGSE